MAGYNLGTASGRISIDSSQLKEADISLRQAGRGLIGFGAAAVAGFGYVIKTAADFDKSMSFVAAVTNTSKVEMDKLREAAIELGKQGPFGPKEVADSFVDLAKAGLSATEIIQGAGKASIQLAAAGDLPLASAAEIAVNVMRTFNIQAKDLTSVVDVMAGAANASTIEVDDLATSLKYAGALAHATGISFGDTATALAILGNQGIRGSTAGTSLRRIFLNLTPTTKAAASALSELGIISKDGTNKFIDAAGNTKPLAEVFQILQDSVKGMHPDKVKDLFNAIFGARAVPSAIIFSQQGAAGFKDMMAEINRTSAADVASKRLDNLAGSVTRLKAAVQATFISEGSPFQKGLKAIADAAREAVLWFGQLPQPLQTALLAALGLGGVLALLAGGFLLTVGNIVRAIRVAKELADVLPIITNAVKVLNAGFLELLLNPVVLLILLIVAAVALLAYGFYKLYTENEKFRDIVNTTWQDIQKVWDKILDFFKQLPEYARTAWKKTKEYASAFWQWLQDQPANVGSAILGFFSNLAGAIGGFFARIGGDIGGFFSKVGSFFGGLASAAGGGVVTALGAVGDFFTTIGSAAGSGISTAFNAVTNFFKAIPGVVGNVATTIGDFFANVFTDLPYKAGFAIGFLIGRVLRGVKELVANLATTGVDVVKAIVSWFANAIPAVIDALNNIKNTVLGWGTSLVTWALDTGISFVQAIANWFVGLPQLIKDILTTVFSTLFNWGTSVVTWAANFGLSVVQSILSFLQTLPGQILAILTNVLTTFFDMGVQLFNSAVSIGSSIFNGIVNFIQGIPAKVGEIFSNLLASITSIAPQIASKSYDIGLSIFNGVIGGIGDLWGFMQERFLELIRDIGNLASSAYNAAKSFAAGLWDGFKSGLGIGSPSYIERAAWTMQNNVQDVLKNLQGQVRGFQSAGDAMGLTVGTPAFGQAAVAAKGGTVQTNVVNIDASIKGPVVRREEDITKLSRRLTADIAQAQRATG